MSEFSKTILPTLTSLGIMLGAAIAGLVVNFIFFQTIARLPRRRVSVLYGSLMTHTKGPLKYVLALFAVNLVLTVIILPASVLFVLSSIFRSLFIIAVSWLIMSLLIVAEDVILSRYNINVSDNLQARKIYTQTQTIRRILVVYVVILAAVLILMGFEGFRQLGTGILASAGLVSIILGLAAQRIFGNFLAGVQIAFTQPIRVDDVVIVENEWGRIEEITLTYVVVRIWDLRRMILPISYFIEKPFQNWTRISADILGTVFIYTDYTLPINPVRAEFERIVNSSTLWDRKVCVLQVTNASENTMELRALVSAGDSAKAFDLRCLVREKLIEFIKNNYPDALPKTRAEFKSSIEGSHKKANS